MKNVFMEYMTKINIKVKLAKKRALELMEKRSDMEIIKISKVKNEDLDRNDQL